MDIKSSRYKLFVVVYTVVLCSVFSVCLGPKLLKLCCCEVFFDLGWGRPRPVLPPSLYKFGSSCPWIVIAKEVSFPCIACRAPGKGNQPEHYSYYNIAARRVVRTRKAEIQLDFNTAGTPNFTPTNQISAGQKAFNSARATRPNN